MKRTLPFLMIAVFAAFMASCGGSTKDDKKKDDTTKKDTVVADKKPVVKDFKYFEGIAKDLKLDGLELTQTNKYCDTASNAFTYGFTIKDAKDKGADKINIAAGSVKRLGNKEDVVCASLADFEKAQKGLFKDGKRGTLSDFKEWKKNQGVFYYMTIKGVSDQMGGKKNYNKLFARYVKDDVYLDVQVSVYDNTAELIKAEQILVKAMEYFSK